MPGGEPDAMSDYEKLPQTKPRRNKSFNIHQSDRHSYAHSFFTLALKNACFITMIGIQLGAGHVETSSYSISVSINAIILEMHITRFKMNIIICSEINK